MKLSCLIHVLWHHQRSCVSCEELKTSHCLSTKRCSRS